MDPNFKINGLNERILRIEGDTNEDKAEAMEILAFHLFELNKRTFEHVTYIKFPILVPKHVMGYIIGNEGKNINRIRTYSTAKIDVNDQYIEDDYQRIDVSGKVRDVAISIELIYDSVCKYYYYPVDKKKPRSLPENKVQKEIVKEVPVKKEDVTIEELGEETSIEFVYPEQVLKEKESQIKTLFGELEFLHNVKITLSVLS